MFIYIYICKIYMFYGETPAGYCHRAEHQRAWGRFTSDLDYRLFDANDKTYFKGPIHA